ncbi:MAG: long-chain fatty acid--CoA ligase [Myxococcales bacterium]|nr:long-chain fatty acid--CoA ligase [Myxococcales bacterium]
MHTPSRAAGGPSGLGVALPYTRAAHRTGGVDVTADTIPSRLFEQARRRPEAPAYYVRRDGVWHATSWKQYASEVRRAARAMLALGLEPGQSVCILGFNRPEWTIFDVAAMCLGGAPAGIYTTSSPAEVRYIAHHCEAPLVLVENHEQLHKVLRERDALPALRAIVLMQGVGAPQERPEGLQILTWEQFLAAGDRVLDAKVYERIAALEPDGLATLIYTSGTTGPPKGVMLSHRNLAWTASVARELVDGRPEDTVLSYLPLSHIAEQMFTIHGAITTGYSVHYAQSIEKVPDDLREVQPTVFFGVPRIWEKFHAGITAKLAQATGLKKRLVDWAMDVGRRVAEVRSRGGQPQGALALQYAVARKLVYDKVKPALGLGRARLCVSGAAPIAREVLEFLAGLDVIVLEVYGQSEDCGPTSFNRPQRFRFGSVGPVIPGVEVKIAPDEEILVRGPNVFLGYYKEPEATRETLVDGWLCSGDLGRLDADGFLWITGRKKEILITAGGKNIAPKNIEATIKNHPLVNEAVVIGDRRKYLTALVTLDPEACKARGIDMARANDDPAVRAEIQRQIDRANEELARVEQIKKFTILPRNFGIDTGELTPTLKVKRNKVAEIWAREIEAMYAE